MQTKIFRRGENKVFYKKNMSDDLLDYERFGYKTKPFREIFGVRDERTGKIIAKRILRIFFAMLAKDLIQGLVFLFPFKDFGVIAIANTTDYDRDDYLYCFATGGYWYQPRIVTKTNYHKWSGKEYMLRFNKRFRTELFEAIQKGMRYTNI